MKTTLILVIALGLALPVLAKDRILYNKNAATAKTTGGFQQQGPIIIEEPDDEESEKPVISIIPEIAWQNGGYTCTIQCGSNVQSCTTAEKCTSNGKTMTCPGEMQTETCSCSADNSISCSSK